MRSDTPAVQSKGELLVLWGRSEFWVGGCSLAWDPNHNCDDPGTRCCPAGGADGTTWQSGPAVATYADQAENHVIATCPGDSHKPCCELP